MEKKINQHKMIRVVDQLLDLGFTKTGIADRINVDIFMFQNAYRNKSQTAQDMIYTKIINEFKSELINKNNQVPMTMEAQIAELRVSMKAGFQQIEETMNKILELLQK